MIVKTKFSEKAEQFDLEGVRYVGRRVLVDDADATGSEVDYPLFVSDAKNWVSFILFRLDYDRRLIFVDPSILKPYQRPELKQEGT